MSKAQVLIVGYGNIGRACYRCIKAGSDMEVVGILTRDRNRVIEADRELRHLVHDINDGSMVKVLEADVALLAGGSANDLPITGPWALCHLPVKSVVDSYDNHDSISPGVDSRLKLPTAGYWPLMDGLARANEKTAVICQGWDPGLFSLFRILLESIFPGQAHTFYGLSKEGGLSMGHSEALRQIDTVQDARSYTHTYQSVVEKVKAGEDLTLPPTQRLWRENVLVLEPDSDQIRQRVIKDIEDHPYFCGYTVENHFISKTEMETDHSGRPHDGLVLAGDGQSSVELKVNWADNPTATAGIMVAAARAGCRLHQAGTYGAVLPHQVPVEFMSAKSADDLVRQI